MFSLLRGAKMEVTFKDKILEKFLRYVSIDTTSDEKSNTYPSTPAQLELGRLLVQELTQAGATNVNIDENGYVYAEIVANTSGFPTIGLIAHMDTSSAASSSDVKPQLAQGFKGGKLLLNEEKNIILDSNEFEEMKNFVGDDLITTDGTTLLGADDKAGIAEIMTVCEYLLANPSIPHGTIKIAFTPDEEIGRGADKFNVEAFAADFAYTLDGQALPFYEYECFNAADVEIDITGVNIHPGSAKNKMKNAANIANKLINMLPAEQTPEHTEGYEGFYHVCGIVAKEDFARINMLIRDHDKEKFESKKQTVRNIVEYLNKLYGDGTIEAEIKDSYYNMAEVINAHPEVTQRIKKAMSELGLQAQAKPIRGGTDGSKLSFMNLPCPNLPTGGANFHSVFECVSLNQMEKCSNLLLNILTLN